ncbi:conserved hypothetical protein [Nostocoides japonicum T1-X7]|uniref:Pyridoxamine 5'-phosphate oxidase family protein n=1 Tax=Nostocoides japonicum T1-X7 TaxID=1194083 RepID=A0A077LZT1_9MICO|nr:pyridoxamine 5'-phosphate oxidase family protein [Tetrasphaera japonica]CCH79508.1 conserved hypothetical protein [Tetrasphaera japonica T1-X7]
MYEPEDDETAVRALDDTECWELLRGEEFARLAFHLAGEVHIVPLNYATDGGRLFFRTAEGSKLLGVTMNDDVALEIDHFDDEAEKAWSVVVRGNATVLEGSAADVVEELPLRPWVPTAKYVVVAITPGEITGRAFRISKPWQHMIPQP